MTTKKQLIAAAKKQTSKDFKELKTTLSECKDVKDIKSKWFLNQLITPATNRKELSKKDLVFQILKTAKNRKQKNEQEKIDRINRIFAAGKFDSINITIEWKNNRTWGANPTAEAQIYGDKYEYLKSSSIGGCGYDKESTAFAEALNQSDSFVKTMLVNSAKIAKEYGHRNGLLSGGVGTGCYYSIFEKLGYKMTKTGSGKMFDVYSIVKK